MVSADSHKAQYLVTSTVGIVFLGTPHRGTSAQKWGEIVAVSAKAMGFDFEDSILKDLREDSETLRDLLYKFSLLVNKTSIEIHCCFEQHETDYGKRYGVKILRLRTLVSLP